MCCLASRYLFSALAEAADAHQCCHKAQAAPSAVWHTNVRVSVLGQRRVQPAPVLTPTGINS